MTPTAYRIAPGTVTDVEAAVAIDDAASALYEPAGIVFDFPSGHPMVEGERAAWTASAALGGLFFAFAANDAKAGFAALARKDGEAYLEQISVLPAHMRRGVGAMLMATAIEWARRDGHRRLWLTTYDHLAWNAPYYERFGFETVDQEAIGPDIRAALDVQRRYLPCPAHRIAMRLDLPPA